MKKPKRPADIVPNQRLILWLSLPLIGLLILCSSVGLTYPDLYALATQNWRTQTLVQDAVNLCIVAPILTVAALYSYQGIRFAFIMWGGTLAYLSYTFLIYCFAVPFNSLFLAYCLTLGLSIFSLAWFLATQIKRPVVAQLNNRTFQKTTAIYFITTSVAFYALWLLEIVPATFTNSAPPSLVTVGLMTNPVHVIDLAIFLPLVFFAGIIALKQNSMTAIFTPVILTFFVLMDITIAVLTVVMAQNGLGGSIAVAGVMGVLAVFSIVCLGWFVKIAQDNIAG